MSLILCLVRWFTELKFLLAHTHRCISHNSPVVLETIPQVWCHYQEAVKHAWLLSKDGKHAKSKLYLIKLTFHKSDLTVYSHSRVKHWAEGGELELINNQRQTMCRADRDPHHKDEGWRHAFLSLRRGFSKSDDVTYHFIIIKTAARLCFQWNLN